MLKPNILVLVQILLDWGRNSAFVFFLIEVSLTYNIVLVSGVQQSDSVIYIYINFMYIY